MRTTNSCTACEGVTETFPYGAETFDGLHCLPCVFQIEPAFLGKNETEQPVWTPQPEEGVVPGPLPADGAIPCARNPLGPVKISPCNAYLQTIVPSWNATQQTQRGFVHATLTFVLADFFPVVLHILLTDHEVGIVTLQGQVCNVFVLSTFGFHSQLV